MFDIMSVTQKKLLCVCVFYLFMADHCITISLSEGKKKFLLSVKTRKNNVQITTGLHINYFFKNWKI